MAHAVAAALDDADAVRAPCAVALSGGRDSVALLDALAAHGRLQGHRVVALHVHHGLSPNADAWAAFCTALCAGYAIPCIVRRVNVARAPRTSVEATARRARYAALSDAAREAGVATVLLAHHRDDQAETLLLQLLRGAGPHGLAAMPAQRVGADGMRWLRPLLDVPRAAIEACVAERGLRYVDDESNADTRHARNAIRRSVAPALAAIAPGYATALARAAALQGDAARLADDLATADARNSIDGASLDRDALLALPAYRARNLLRWFLRSRGLPPPSQARLEDMWVQLTQARPDAQVRLAHAGAEIGIHRGRVSVHAQPPAPFDVAWRGEPELALPHGILVFGAVEGAGLDRRRLAAAAVRIRRRSGGERIQLAADRPRRALSALLQERGIPRWERSMLPLVFCGDALAAIPGIGIDAAFRVPPGEVGVTITWHPGALPAPTTARR
ncbi:MAG: tRNA lysidine(34) synthetase TilS [Casimicrobiaceae bacterium]